MIRLDWKLREYFNIGNIIFEKINFGKISFYHQWISTSWFTCLESIFASSLAFLIRLTIQRSASSGDMFNFSANILILIHWWMRQNVSKINKRAFSMKSSKQAIKKKSFNKTWKRWKIRVKRDKLTVNFTIWKIISFQ